VSQISAAEMRRADNNAFVFVCVYMCLCVRVHDVMSKRQIIVLSALYLIVCWKKYIILTVVHWTEPRGMNSGQIGISAVAAASTVLSVGRHAKRFTLRVGDTRRTKRSLIKKHNKKID